MRSLSGVLTAAIGRQILNRKGWGVESDSSKDGYCDVTEYCLLPGTLRSRIAGLDIAESVRQNCLAQCEAVSAVVTLCHYGAKLHLRHHVQPVSSCWNDVQSALQAQLASLDIELQAAQDTISLNTGGRYEGDVVLERNTANLTISAMSHDALPAGYQFSDADVARWLDAIFTLDADVLALNLVVVLSTYSLPLAACEVERVCIVPAGAPVRHWFPRQTLATLTDQARNVIGVLTSSLSSFR